MSKTEERVEMVVSVGHGIDPEQLFVDRENPKCVLCNSDLKEYHYKSGDGTFYVCTNRETCGAYYAVLSDGGIRLRRVAECPDCHASVSESFSRKDDAYFKCRSCQGSYDYDEASGTLTRRPHIVRPEAPCPAGCGGKALKFEKKDRSGVFWRCSNCERYFDDKDEAPVLRQKDRGK